MSDFRVSESIVQTLSLDDPLILKEMLPGATVKYLRHGARITFADEMQRQEFRMELMSRWSGWDISPQAASACVRAARKMASAHAEGKAHDGGEADFKDGMEGGLP